MRRDLDDRRRAFRLGLSAESRAAWMLRLKGHRILERRWRCRLGEIDLVARRGHTVVFVEVKARAEEATAIDAVGPRSRARILAAADLWVAEHPFYAAWDRRFDVVAVLPARWPIHRPDAFRGDDLDLARRRW
ncbi:MAG: YraN family protein [Phyllobacteriaceae bacterium]|nr:YraN family protein [Phyllobacteriaceae bacterium]